ncbi:MAG TPA: histidine kinase dimerization/phosphoacceptor domain -containing protein [Puia sp.]|uniref:histidine kinase dimerization/phosphoacceptor domain -containing protein n=1 Tax=Puia sp. TaxID=2045100 RepID=UPI002C070272|nr:histidine kinase dimerization/phosphoacceptor domain -containing protein [Puia sp.]HVU99689.1 histidine kinase dimerization/phosphoacceptor domain -containing protein [Puia sp.]
MRKKQPSDPWLSAMIMLLLITTTFGTTPVFAQYYPAPELVSPNKEPSLLLQLRTGNRAAEKIDALLGLANIHYNKPIKTLQDFPLATQYTREALGLSRQLQDEKRITESIYALASIYLLEDSVSEVENLLPAINNDTVKNNVQVGLAFTYVFCPQRPLRDALGKGKFYAEQGQQSSTKLRLKKNELLTRQYLAFIHQLEGDEKKGTQEINDIIQQYKQLKIEGVQYPYLILAEMHWMQGKFTDALNDYYITTSAFEQSPDKTALSHLYYLASTLYGRMSEHKKEDDALRMGLEQCKSAIGRYSANVFIGEMVRRLIRSGQSKKALSFVDSLTRIFTPVTFDQQITTVDTYARAYLATGQYQQAERYFVKSFTMTKAAGWATGADYGALGYFYVEHKEYVKARPYLLKALAMQDNMTSVYEKRQLTYMLFLVDSATQHYTSAIRYSQQNHALDDSLELAKRHADVQKLMIQYETEKKDAAIKALEQKEQLVRARQERADFVRNVVIGFAILFLIAAGIFYRQYRGKKELSEIITQKNQKQQLLLQQLNRSLSEKEWLLKEVHHRVKNNLHTVMCLLESQSLNLESEALKAIDDSKHRIYAMSLIHQQLYETEDLTTVDLEAYIRQFIGYLKDSFSIGPRVHFQLDIQPIQIEVPVAIPLALIINEAVTNSIKHAFRGIDHPTIAITLHSHDDTLTLIIKDNGIGIANVEKILEKRSLGMKLIHGLSGDLNGKLKLETSGGLQISIECSTKPFVEVVYGEEEVGVV